jgi:hypothetical protein
VRGTARHGPSARCFRAFARPAILTYVDEERGADSASTVDADLRAELLARREEDQRIRKAVVEPGKTLTREQQAEWERIDEANTMWLNDLVDARGWPGESLVGVDGAGAAWLFAQHADRQPGLQRKFLELLREAVAAGEASATNLAYMEDRVRVAEGRPQLYGTQFTSIVVRWGPFPIEDEERVDERRAAVGLGPLADYAADLNSRKT